MNVEIATVVLDATAVTPNDGVGGGREGESPVLSDCGRDDPWRVLRILEF